MRKKQNVFLLPFFILIFLFSITQSIEAEPINLEVKKLLTSYHEAFNNRDLETMSSLWLKSEDTSLFGPPKGMAFLIQGWGAIEKKYKSMFESSLIITCSFHNPQITILADNVAVINLYEILIIKNTDENKEVIGQQRATFVVQKIDGKWLIVNCHLSVFPA